LNREEKSRLLRIGKRFRRGPMNTVLDPTEFASGSAILELSEAVKRSGRYDPWAPVDAKENVVQKDGFQPTIKAKVKVAAFLYFIF
jgi:nucleolar protein 53